jgi:hypothetical protein
MKVYKKLSDARILLQQKSLSKSGHNKFAGYKYFELGDFLPAIQDIFNQVGLVDVITFNKEVAMMQIFDTEDGSSVLFTSPMGSASLKGCHEVQNIGAVETYQRRYLYVTAMAIVEHDALDATTGSVEPVKKEEPKPKKIEGQKGDFQIIIDEPSDEEDLKSWMIRVQEASHLLLDVCSTDADVMTIFKKNKVLFDTVKQLDPDFFKGMMVKFSETKAKYKKD